MTHDPVNHPKHYTQHPSGVECITVTEHMNFCLGNAMKYIWRAGDKGNAIEDLKKARWYIEREIQRLEAHGVKSALVPITLDEAKRRKVCRICQQPSEPMPGNPFVLDYGAEHAHKLCIEGFTK